MANKESKTTFKADISQLNKAFKEAAQQIRIANSEFKAASAGMEDWSKNADGVSAKLKQLNSNLDNEKKKLESLESQLKRTAQEYGENSNEVQQLTVRVNNQKAKVAETEKEIGKYENRLKDMAGETKTAEKNTDNLSEKIEDVGEEAVDTTNKLDKFKDGLKTGVTGAAKIAGETILGVSVAMAAVGGASTNVAVDMDKAMKDFAASTGTAETELGKYQGILENIYKNNYGEDFKDISDGLATILQQIGPAAKHWDDSALQKYTESAYVLRDTFGYEIAESIRATDAMMEHFCIDGQVAMDLIAEGAQNGLDYSGEMIDSIIEYSSQFSKLGFTAEDMFAIFQQGADSGAWNLDKVGDAIKEFSIRAIDGSDSTTAGFETIGLSAEEMSAKFGQGGETARKAFEETVRALSSIEDPLEKDAAGVALFGTMWEDLGADVVKQLGNIQGGAYDTTEALKKIKEVKYNGGSAAAKGKFDISNNFALNSLYKAPSETEATKTVPCARYNAYVNVFTHTNNYSDDNANLTNDDTTHIANEEALRVAIVTDDGAYYSEGEGKPVILRSETGITNFTFEYDGEEFVAMANLAKVADNSMLIVAIYDVDGEKKTISDISIKPYEKDVEFNSVVLADIENDSFDSETQIAKAFIINPENAFPYVKTIEYEE